MGQDDMIKAAATANGHGQGHMFARLDDIELSWMQHHESTRMANATGDPSGLIAGAPVEIGARRSNDR